LEENPVRAGLALHPGAYLWSSYRANALGENGALLTPHPHYCSLGRSPDERRAAYAELFAPAGEGITPVSCRPSGDRSQARKPR
jgi:putative transposase